MQLEIHRFNDGADGVMGQDSNRTRVPIPYSLVGTTYEQNQSVKRIMLCTTGDEANTN